MKIALKAANSLYVCAEEGGGIDTRNPRTPVAVRANRREVHEWETFEVIILSNGFVALETINGFYVTAELGGGSSVRTNERAIGPWERFTPIGSIDAGFGLRTWDGRHFVCAVVNATRTQK